MSCINCTGAIAETLANDEKILKIAQDKANKENKVIALFRNESGQLCIASDGDPTQRYLTPQL